MCRDTKNRPEAEFVKMDENICTYRWPDTGEEFTTIAEYVPNIDLTEYRVLRAKVKVQWVESIPRTKQLAQLKTIFPGLQNIPKTELLSIIKSGDEWEVGELLIDEAENLVKEGQNIGLKIIAKVVDE